MTSPCFRALALRRRALSRAAYAALLLGLALTVRAQTVTPVPVDPATGKPAAPPEEKAVELSPFEVRADDDTGYQAMNTTSGSRLATSLKDTAASISPFTPEFLADIAATNVAEMLNYASNAELNAGDSEGSGFNNPRDFNSAGGEPLRVRGIPADVSADYAENAAPMDLYNVERAEVASGPNSILFGSGNAGGLVSLSTKKANLNRPRYSVQAQFGSWDYQRYTADLNYVLKPRTLAVRVNALYSDAQGWRTYDYNRAKRISPAITYRPWTRTTLSASYERGFVQHSVGLRWNASDQVTRWLAANRPVTDAAASPTLGTAGLGANQRFTFYTQDNAVFNLRNELQTTTSPQPADTLLPVSLFPYEVNWAGPAPKITQDFRNYQIALEQRVGEALVVQAAFLHNNTFSRARSFVYNNNTMNLYGDPNLTIPAPGGTGTVPNPRAGQLYLESNQSRDFTRTVNDVARLTVAYDLKTGKWFGEHRFALLGENAKQHGRNASQREILIDATGRPLANAGTPENAQNLLWRRSYLKEGDFSTYALTGLYTPLDAFSLNGATVAPRIITTGDIWSKKETKSLMAAAQSTWLAGRLNTTLGYREDRIDYFNTEPGRVLAGDPRLAAGEAILNEVAALPGYTLNQIQAHTFTAGGVLHLNKRFSVFYNQSDNTGAPRFKRRVLPFGNIPGTPKGKGRDAGVMIDFLGDDRFFARLSYFETSQIGDAAVSPSGETTNATALGRQQTLAILQAFLGAGKITQAQYDAQSFNWNAALIDTATQGYEAELVGNPTKNWTLRATYSYSQRNREDFFEEGKAFFAQKEPEWRNLAAGNATLTPTVETNIASIEQEISDRKSAQEGGFGSIPHKATLTTRYKFSGDGLGGERLKGAFIGGALRYQSKIYAQTDTRAPSAGGTGKDYWSNGLLQADAFAGYRFRLPWRKLSANLQLNVRNLTNSYLSTTARWNADFSGARRIYLRDPRSYRFTATVEY